MTIEEMRRGAEITCQLDMTDEELALASLHQETMLTQGSEPGFFQIDDEGNDI